MSETESKYLDTFPGWLASLGSDAQTLGALLEDDLPSDAAKALAGGLNYLFKSLDLIPDGIDDIGYLDDAFVLRVAADLAVREPISDVGGDRRTELERLAGECDIIRQFLEGDYSRLESYVLGLRTGAARGRSVADILQERPVRDEFFSDLKGFASTYEAPSFAREEKNLIKLRAFFDAKLPK